MDRRVRKQRLHHKHIDHLTMVGKSRRFCKIRKFSFLSDAETRCELRAGRRRQPSEKAHVEMRLDRKPLVRRLHIKRFRHSLDFARERHHALEPADVLNRTV